LVGVIASRAFIEVLGRRVAGVLTHDETSEAAGEPHFLNVVLLPLVVHGAAARQNHAAVLR
jgi:hypothetical protein